MISAGSLRRLSFACALAVPRRALLLFEKLDNVRIFPATAISHGCGLDLPSLLKRDDVRLINQIARPTHSWSCADVDRSEFTRSNLGDHLFRFNAITARQLGRRNFGAFHVSSHAVFHTGGAYSVVGFVAGTRRMPCSRSASSITGT